MITHIRLELRPDGDTFAGRAISDVESREFHGWLGLMGAIEALYPQPAPTPGTFVQASCGGPIQG